MRRTRAISIRQPWTEEILLGDKKFEYKKTVCRILNEPVYICALPKFEKKDRERFEKLEMKPGDWDTC